MCVFVCPCTCVHLNAIPAICAGVSCVCTPLCLWGLHRYVAELVYVMCLCACVCAGAGKCVYLRYGYV